MSVSLLLLPVRCYRAGVSNLLQAGFTLQSHLIWPMDMEVWWHLVVRGFGSSCFPLSLQRNVLATGAFPVLMLGETLAEGVFPMLPEGKAVVGAGSYILPASDPGWVYF